MLSYFILSYSSALRDLHSFPTRRSSDLKSMPLRGARVQQRWQNLCEMVCGHAAPPYPHLGARASRPHRPRNPEDRKSTRLNSSHVEISYAVFCLKKKIK